MNWHVAAQVWIVCWSLAGVWLMTGKKHVRWGFVCGLISQPAWFYSTIDAHQWGQFFMACVYTGMWCRGIYNNWRR